MAAAELLRSGLPPPWSYGVMQDGRVFFINEESKSTTWLHPVHNHPVQSGHISLRELPRGWELSHTPEGIPYYIDHMNLRTSFINPLTGESALPVHEGSLTPTEQPQNFKRASLRRRSNKQKIIDKTPTAKRTDDAPVAIKGWLYKQEGGGINKSWKKRWFVLSDFCLYFYKGSEEGQTIGSLLLPSYKIDYCNKEDGVNKRYAFKAEHQNMRTCYFATDTQDDQARWMKALTLATVLQKDPNTDYNQAYSSGGFDQSHQRSSSQDRDLWPDNREDTHPKALESGGFGDPRDQSYSPHFNREDLDTPPPIPQNRNYSPNLESTRISQVGSNKNLTEEETGGFGESRDRLSRRGRSSAGLGSWGVEPLTDSGAPQGQISADPETGGFIDPNRSENRLSSAPVDSKENGEDNMSAQVSQRHGYGHDPRMRSSYESGTFQQQQNMRNSFQGPNPNHPDNRGIDPRHSMPPGGQYPDNRRDASFRDSRGYPVDPRMGPPGPGYRNTDRDSLSSRGSRSMNPPRDHNYNMPKGAPPGEHSQNYPRNRTSNGYSNSSALEQSTDSMEKTLDRSFDNSQQLPGYDSFRKERPDPSIYRRKDGPVVSREPSMTDVQRTDSLRHLQEWTKSQVQRTHSRPSSSYSNASDRPISDGRRIYSSSNPPSERSSVRGAPATESDGPPKTYRSPPPEPLQLNVAAAQSYTQSNSGPSATSTADADDSPQRPPIPAAFREQYIKELADTKTPHTRNDLLSSINIQRIRQAEPLVFQYPEVSPVKANKVAEERRAANEVEEDRERHMAKSGSRPPAQQEDGHGEASMNSRDPPIGGFNPTKSWDDLNDLDAEDAEERFKDSRRIERLMAEKRMVEGQGHPNHVNPQPVVSSRKDFHPHQNHVYHPEKPSNGYNVQAYQRQSSGGQGQTNYNVRDSQNGRTDSYRFVPSPEKPVRRNLEPHYTQSQEHIYQNTDSFYRPENGSKDRRHSSQPPSNHGNRPVKMFSERPTDKSWQSLNHAEDESHPFGPYDAQDLPLDQIDANFISQSERDVRYPYVNRHAPRSPFGDAYSRSHDNREKGDERLTQSLGNLHVDVGGWPENAQAGTPRERQPQQPPPQQALLDRANAGENHHHPTTQGAAHLVGSPRPTHQQFKVTKHDIETIKEDPNMSDQDTLTTKTLADLQKHLSGHRLRLSIAAGDLGEKSHEELVLLLIQLRRGQSELEQTRDHYRAKLNIGRPQEKDYKIQRKNSIGRLNDVVEREHDGYLDLRKMYDEIENQLEVTKPLVSLLDNMVQMGSLYGGNNLMLASQYKQHKLGPGEYTAPKKMIVFSRQHQEEKLSKEQEEELQQLLADEVDLEDKLQQLYRLDRDLQEKSLAVMNLQQNKDRLEKIVNQARKDIQMTEDPRSVHQLKNQLRHQEAELGTLRQHLAESSRVLEEISAEDAKVENEVMLLRKKIYGINRSQNSPTSLGGENVRARLKLEEELEGIQSIMVGMSKQQSQLSDTIKALRHSTPDLSGAGTDKSDKAYMETDMDSGRSRDLSKEVDPAYRSGPYGNKHQVAVRETREQTVTATTGRDRSKSAPPPVEREMPVQGQARVETTQMVTQARREVPVAAPRPQVRPQPDRSSVRSSTGSQYSSMPRAAPARGQQQQATYQKVVTRETRHSGINQVPSPEGSTSRDPPHGQHKDGLYRAEMRMVTPEPREEHRYRGDPRLNSPAPSNASSTQHRKSDGHQGQGHQYASQVGVKVMVTKQVKRGGAQRVSEYIDSLNTPEAEEQRSFDILEDSQVSESGGSGFGALVEAVPVLREGAGSMLHDPNTDTNSNKDLDLIVVKSAQETGKHGLAKSMDEEITAQNATITGGSKRAVSDYEKSLQREVHVKKEEQAFKVSMSGGSSSRKVKSDYEKTLLEGRSEDKENIETIQSVEQVATGGATSKRVISDYEKQLLSEQREKVAYSHTTSGSISLPASDHEQQDSAEKELDRKLRSVPSIQRTDSRSKRLTSNLAMSLLEGKEQVIREALKRVSSDASDYSAKRGSNKPYQNFAPLAEYLATMNSSSRAKYEMELKDLETSHSAMVDTGKQTLLFNLLSDNPNTTNTIEVAKSLSMSGSAVPMGDHVQGMQHEITHEHSYSSAPAHATNLTSTFNIEHAHTTSSGHFEGQGQTSQNEAVVLQEQRQCLPSHTHSQMYASKPMSEVHPQQQPQQRPQQRPHQQQQPQHHPDPYSVHRVEEQTISFNAQGPPSDKYQDDRPAEDGQVYEPIELSEADDNTKKFFGLLPKDAARTVREVKKKESERRSRERKRFYVNVHGPADIAEAESMEKAQEFHRTQSLPRRVSAPVYQTPQPGTHDDSVLKRRSVGIIPAKKAQQLDNRPSASDRLFGNHGNTRPSTAPTQRSQEEHIRRTSDLFTPRPFSAKTTESVQRVSSTSRLTGGTTVAKVSPYNNNRDVRNGTGEVQVKMRSMEISKAGSGGRRVASSLEKLDQRALDAEERKVRQYWADRLQQRHQPRGRYMTISSAQPAKMEHSPQATWKPTKVHSAAGDLITGRWNDNIPDVIRSEPLKDLTIDHTTIDREVLFIPDKVDIPERYVHDSETEEVTEEDRMRRMEKTSQIKRMLAAQSLAEWQEEEAHGRYPQRYLQAEMQRREQLLDLKQELAIQVTQKSKEVAGTGGKPGVATTWGNTKPAPAATKPVYVSRTVIGSLSPSPTTDTRRSATDRRIRTLSR